MRVNYECEYEELGETHYYIFETESGILKRIVDATKVPDEIITYVPLEEIKFVNEKIEAYVGVNSDIVFRININYDDPGNVRVWVKKDEETLPRLLTNEEYDLDVGSTIVKLKGDYVKGLSVGKYIIKVEVKGISVSQEFAIKLPSPNKPKKYKVPNTGIDNN